MPAVEVAVPAEVRPGDTFTVHTGKATFDVVCPDGVAPGDALHVELPGPSAADDEALLQRISDFMEQDADFVQTSEGFLFEHCSKFARDPSASREYPIEFQSLHQRYARLVEAQLEELLASLGLTPDAFVEALRKCGAEERGSPAYALLRSLDATSSFDAFLELMAEAKLSGGGMFAS